MRHKVSFAKPRPQVPLIDRDIAMSVSTLVDPWPIVTWCGDDPCLEIYLAIIRLA